MKKPVPAALAPVPAAGLRHDAEARLRARQKKPRADAGFTKRAAEPQQVFHELQVHQIELEMQNIELQESQNRMGEFVEKYTDLYDFAPVGYFSLDEQARILEVNLTGATLLGVSRNRLIKQRLSPWIAPANRPAFLAFLAQVFANPAKKICEVALMQAGGTSLWVRFHGISALGITGSRKWCRVTVSDITAYKKSDERVAASEIRYRRLFETAHDGVLLLDPETRKITDANPFMTRLLGYSREQLVGKELFEIGLLKDEVASQEMFRKLKRSHEVRYEDLPLESQDGRHQEVEVVANLYQENGQAVIQCNIRDITARKLVEQALTESEARYRGLFDSMDEGYCIIEMIFNRRQMPVDYRFLEVNRSFEKQTGLIGATGKRMRELVADMEPHWYETYGRVARTGKPVRVVSEAKALDGRWFDLYAFRVGGPTSRKVAILFTNITARIRTEQELAEKARLLDLSHDAIIVRDIAGRIRYWNHGAEELYGWSRKEALGKSSMHLLKTKFPTPFKQMVKELYRKNRWIGELGHTKRNGQRITVLARKTLDRDAQGNPAAVLETLTDITARKLAESTQHRVAVLAASNVKLKEEIARRQTVETSLKQSEQHQRHLLSQSRLMQQQLRHLSREVLRAQEEERKRISRELHDVVAQTLTGINLRLAALKKSAGLNTRDFGRNLARTQRLVERSVAIVHQFARELRPAVLDDLGLVPALLSFMKTFTAQTGVRTHLTAFAGVEELDTTRRTTLYRIAQEALTNVARHAHASRVEVGIQQLAHGGICMTIKDDGKSFSVVPALVVNGGKRLGLLGMRERLEMVGGEFEIESAVGQGTAIIARIPFGKLARGGRNGAR